MSLSLAALKTELTTDPTALGYASPFAAGQDDTLAAILNLVRAGITIQRGDISNAELWHAIGVADYTALPGTPTAAQLSTERRFLSWLSGIGAIPTIRLLNADGSDTPVVTNLRAMFASGTPTLTRLLALSTRTGSRAEQLFGVGLTITNDDVAKARKA